MTRDPELHPSHTASGRAGAIAWRSLTAFIALTCVAHGMASPTTSFAATPGLRPGQEVVLGEYFEVWPGVCQGVARPVVVITKRPSLGELIVQGGQAMHHAGGKCGRVQTGTSIVIYKAGAKGGEDDYAWEVRYQHARRAPMKLSGKQTITGR